MPLQIKPKVDLVCFWQNSFETKCPFPPLLRWTDQARLKQAAAPHEQAVRSFVAIGWLRVGGTLGRVGLPTFFWFAASDCLTVNRDPHLHKAGFHST